MEGCGKHGGETAKGAAKGGEGVHGVDQQGIKKKATRYNLRYDMMISYLLR